MFILPPYGLDADYLLGTFSGILRAYFVLQKRLDAY